ncbi:MAG: Hsp20/alpha crystallin family protein [Deltaproteobacteria bacterium]|nr:Hsp20/alpha crystallin family protein [Deltaproteobacteria bacterium]
MTALTLYDPFRGLLPKRSFFDDLFKPFFFETLEETDSALTPRVDVSETEHEYLVRAELPGYSEKEVDLEITDGLLKLSAEHKEEKEDKKEEYHLRERRYGKYIRNFRLPDDVNSEKINAKMEHGVLTVTLPKSEKSKPKKIDIKVH